MLHPHGSHCSSPFKENAALNQRAVDSPRIKNSRAAPSLTPHKASPLRTPAITPHSPLRLRSPIKSPKRQLKSPEKEAHEARWDLIEKEWERWASSPALVELVMSEGVPPRQRAQWWARFLRVPPRVPPRDYLTWHTAPCPWAEQIGLDLARTFPSHLEFRLPERQQALRRVLSAWVNAPGHASIGYCQGMSFLAGLLLLETRWDELAACSLLAGLLESVGAWFAPGMVALQEDTRRLGRLLATTLPGVATHLEALRLDALLFTSKWLLTLFTEWRQWAVVLRLWDLILLCGRGGALRVALATLHVGATELEGADFELLVPMLLHVPSSWQSLVLPTACALDLEALESAPPPPTPSFARPAPSALSTLGEWLRTTFSPAPKSTLKRPAPTSSQGTASKRRRLERLEPTWGGAKEVATFAPRTPQTKERTPEELRALSPRGGGEARKRLFQ